jgi:redox-sensitive bicupin YhaK (pirin superfamily)
MIGEGMGFGQSHDNMEIITSLRRRFSSQRQHGKCSTIKMVMYRSMSAGTGIQYSEFNPNADLKTRKSLQIWLFLIKKM